MNWGEAFNCNLEKERIDMNKALVTYFSAEGTTKQVAERLAKAIDADLFEIVPMKKYTAADIKWTNPLARCNREKIGRKNVPVTGKVENMSEYDIIFVGFPIWYGCAPNVVNSFLQEYDLSGKKIAAFATSGESGIGRTAEKLRPYVTGGTVVDARLFSASAGEKELKAWAEAL